MVHLVEFLFGSLYLIRPNLTGSCQGKIWGKTQIVSFLAVTVFPFDSRV